MRDADIDAILGSDGLMRVSAFIVSGIDPNGFYVSACTLRALIMASPVPKVVGREVIEHLEESVLKGDPELVDCLRLGIAMADLADEISLAHFKAIHDEIRNLEKLPLVPVRPRLDS